MGYTSDALPVDSDSMMEALNDLARNPGNYNACTNVTVQDSQGFLSRTMTVPSYSGSKVVTENIYIDERAGEVIFRLTQNGQETADERVISLETNPTRLEFFHRHSSDSYRTYWKAPLEVVKGTITQLVERAQAISSGQASGNVVGLGMRSQEITGIPHDAMWRAILESIREPAKFMSVTNVSVSEGDGCVRRTMTANGQSRTENIYEYEGACEVVYRNVVNGVESGTERVLALRTHPMCLEFHERRTDDGFRINWTAPKSVVGTTTDQLVNRARALAGVQPTVVGYGVTSDPVQGLTYSNLMEAAAASIRNPSKVIDVDPSCTKIEERDGAVYRTMKLNFNGEVVRERVTINEEAGEISFNKLDARGNPTRFERVLGIRQDPVRLEFFERSVRGNMRVNWQAPYARAMEVPMKMVALARQMAAANAPTIGYGIGSQTIAGATVDSCWRAMLLCARQPMSAGMPVTNAKVTDGSGSMQRTMTLADGRVVTDNVYVRPQAREILYRPVVNGQESQMERVFACREGPRFEMYSRNRADELRQDWTAPKSIAVDVFNKCGAMGVAMAKNPGEFQNLLGNNASKMLGYQ